MDFLKKHYEKVLLGVVLLGLAVAVGFLPFIISSEQQKLNDMAQSVLNPRPKPLTNLDMSLPEAALKRAASPAVINFSAPNRLFNPMPWQKAADGKLLPAEKVGPTALAVTNVRPLYLTLTLDKVVPPEGGGETSYIIGIQKPRPTGTQVSKTQDYCTLNPPTKNKTFAVLDVKGKPDDPEVFLQLIDSGEKVGISTNKPFRRVEGYVADLRYDPEKKHWPNCRVNVRPTPPLAFNGEEYDIVAINEHEVVLSAKSNGKKWTIAANPGTTQSANAGP